MTAPADPAGLLSALARRGQTLAVAESLTGGLLAARITAVPGSSAVFRGAVVAYATDLKVSLLGVPETIPATEGVVSAAAAEAMAVGARARCGATWALSTTGVAGPDAQDGKPAGLVFLGCAGPDGSGSERLDLAGDRHRIRDQTCSGALALLRRRLDMLREDPAAPT